MIEAIILSVFAFAAGTLVGAYIGSPPKSPTNSVLKMNLDNGKEIHMWKGFVDPSNVYVAVNTNEKGGFFDGDGVVFNKEGHIIIVDKKC